MISDHTNIFRHVLQISVDKFKRLVFFPNVINVLSAHIFWIKISYNLLLHIVQDVFEVQIIVVVLYSFSYAALKQGRCLDKKGEIQKHRGGHCYEHSQKKMAVRKSSEVNWLWLEGIIKVVYRNVQAVTDKFTFFSKMRAVVSAIAWRSSNTQRTQRNCGGRWQNSYSLPMVCYWQWCI